MNSKQALKELGEEIGKKRKDRRIKEIKRKFEILEAAVAKESQPFYKRIFG